MRLGKLFASFTLVGGVVVPAAIITKSDADLSLTLASKPPKNYNQGKVVWIVGASSGIGASLAVDFAKDGAQVIISARREGNLKDVAAKCVEAGGLPPTIIPLDVTNFQEHPKVAQAVLEKHGKVDILVLNAGISQRNFALETPLAVTEQITKVNYLSYVSLTQAVAPSMMNRRSGKIVVISSLAGLIGLPISSSYSGSKHALHGFFNGIRAELADGDVKVSLVCPGPVESEIAEKAHKNPRLPDHEDGKKMPTERCTELIMKGLYNNQNEMWISEQPFLWMAYIAAFLPPIARNYVDKTMGPARIHALKTGQGIYGEPPKDKK